MRIGIPFQINHHMHSLAGGIVVDIRNTFDPLLLHKVCDAFNQPRLIDLIRKLGDNDRKSAVFRLLNFRAGAHDDFTAACSIGCTDSRAAHNDAGSRKIRPLDILHQFFKPGIRIVDQAAHTVDHLAHIVRRNIGSHANCDSCRTIDQKIWKPGWKYCGFLFVIVVVRHEVDGFLFDIRQHGHGDLAHTRFRITVGRRRVTVHGAKISMAVDEHIAH